MKLFKAPKCLSDAVAPLVILNYLAGLRIFEYPRGKLRVAPSLIYLLLLLGIFVKSEYAEYNFYRQIKLLKLEYFLFEFTIFVNTFVIMYEMALGYFYTKTINACYRKAAQIDETLRQLGSVFNYSEVYLLTIGVVIVWFTCILFTAIWMAQDMRTDLPTMIWIIVTQIYIINITFSLIFEFSIFVRYLQTRFKLINELLSECAAISTTPGKKLDLFATNDYAKIIGDKQHQNVLPMKTLLQLNRLQSRVRTSVSGERNIVRSQTRSCLRSQVQNHLQMEPQGQSSNQFRDSNSAQRSVTTVECRRRTHSLQTIRQVHLELCKVLRMLCTSFGVQISSEIGTSIMFIVGFLYNLYILWFQRRQGATGLSMLDEASVAITFTILETLKIILINHVCKYATNEGKKTSEIIHEIYGCCSDTDIREEILQFGLQISQSPVEFFTYGVFLNYQLLGSVRRFALEICVTCNSQSKNASDDLCFALLLSAESERCDDLSGYHDTDEHLSRVE
ncbi:PREDICTED: uncharacterized protein LOC106748733 [Dinoponera quadriceps]|uniref:Gustatory receptor n=1 Tax=Dinoponera quadriceps TaxID=609295 RepID=A0A6P3XYI5_DINQU|nr:PREDICTED: uncharacterized protein LOC106748733 [Dinoponera quadriceps]